MLFWLMFALVREAAKRTLGQRHFDVQIMGGIAFHRGQIAEMKTGEGKTLVATLAVVRYPHLAASSCCYGQWLPCIVMRMDE